MFSTVFRFITGVHTYYYKHLFINGFLNKQLHKYINAGVRNDGLLNLYDDDFFNCELPVLPLPEQERIAEILSTWDKAIGLFGESDRAKEKTEKNCL
jgi:restriction endonuclease S subunit